MDASRPRRRSAPFILGLLAILAALPLGYSFFLAPPPTPPTPPPAPVVDIPTPHPTPAPLPAPQVPKALSLKLQHFEGTVEVRRGGGEWNTAHPDEDLRTSDAVRTLENSSADLIGGEAVKIHMEASTEVSVKELTDSISRLMLENGMTQVRVDPKARQTLEMGTAHSDAVASTTGGVFTLSNNGSGTVALATLEGDTTFSGQNKVVIVHANQQSIVRPGQQPSAPASIPSSLLLKVTWPPNPRRRATVTGQTEPGSHVDVGGQHVLADADGHFSLDLHLKEGKNSLQVRALSVGGRQQSEKRDITVDTTPPAEVKVDPPVWK